MRRTPSIALKIWLSISILVFGYFASMVFGFILGRHYESRLEYISLSLYPATQKSQSALTSFKESIKLYSDGVLMAEEDFFKSAVTKTNETKDALKGISQLTGLDSYRKSEVEEIMTQLNDFHSSARRVYPLLGSVLNESMENDGMGPEKVQSNLHKKASVLAGEADDLHEMLRSLTNGFDNDLQMELSSIVNLTRNQRHLNLIVFFGVVVFAIAFVSIIVARSILRPLNRAVLLSETIARGDLTKRIEIQSGDELGVLTNSLNRMVDELAGLVRNTKESGEELNNASLEIKSSAEEQSSAAAEQAVSVQEISATISEIALSSEHMAENMGLVVKASRNTLDTVSHANKIAQDSARGMEEIKEVSQSTSQNILSLGEKSQAIGDIIEIIKDVSRQTNLLALNAAIEATKAGDAGKGFSLVAEEIRRLAEGVAESTTEIREIVIEIQNAVNSSVIAIEDESKKIDKGNQLVQNSKDLLRDINSMAMESTRAAEQVSDAILQQDAGTRDVSKSIQEISGVVHQTAQESAKIKNSLANLSEISERLALAVDQFKLKA
ncbi:MAG: methyl-accepting chemotaxis protein [Thermodesulfobacteriota bacterium]|nr:methyl-accepting chemotaxis protein [Thermodesulfobacteriota bacterium]